MSEMTMPDDEREKKLIAERKAYQEAHPKPWYLSMSTRMSLDYKNRYKHKRKRE